MLSTEKPMGKLNEWSTLTGRASPEAPAPASWDRSLERFFAPLEEKARLSTSLASGHLGDDLVPAGEMRLRRYVYEGRPGGDVQVRLGIFAGIHGDEPAPSFALRRFILLLEDYPEVARGYRLHFYPVCNPSGFEDGTRHARSGLDLNREFWRESREVEVQQIERELREQSFDGIISLHSDDTSDGLYGFVAGATLTQHLLRPALREAARVLPVNEWPRIDGFHATEGIIWSGYEGVLRAPPEQRPHPFEIIFETPHAAPLLLQEQALLIALDVILREYRNLRAYAPNL